MTPIQLLELWGLRCGAPLKTAGLGTQKGEGEGFDETLVAVRYVESTHEFELCREVLVHRYVHGLNLESFRVAGPGEQLTRALYRRQWGFVLGAPPKDVAGKILDRFIDNLIERMRREPFIVPKSWEMA